VKRVPMEPRPHWQSIVEREGLSYAVDRGEDGTARPYWHEKAAYRFSGREIEYLEDLTARLHEMAIQAAWHILDSPRLFASLGLPEGSRELLRYSMNTEPNWSLYGRFDLVYDGISEARMLEYNADTPAGLFEAAVTQWGWLETEQPVHDQWNMIHEYLVQGWQRIGGLGAGRRVHFAVGASEPTEDWVTIAYLLDTAREAGLDVAQLTMESIGWHTGLRKFVDDNDQHLGVCFKMYPWEWMLREQFGQVLLDRHHDTHWVEPAWKTLLGSKTLLVALTEIYPGHRNLLPAYLGSPGGLDAYVAKPVFGWEGAGIEIVTSDFKHTNPAKHTTGQEMVYQKYTPLPRFDGPDVDRAYPVLGTWVINGRPAGLGIRESSGPVTDTAARFVPHYMTTLRSTPDQVQEWLNDPTSAVQ